MNQTLTTIIDIIVALAAFAGMGLGFYNLWSEKQKNKVKLEVIPKSVKDKDQNSDGRQLILTTSNEFNIEDSHGLYSFEVINFSKFDVTVSEIGFLNSKGNDRASIPTPIFYDEKKWPRKLAPRESVTLYADLSSILKMKNVAHVNSAFAITTCKHMEKGTSESLIQLVRYAKKHA